MNGLVNFSGNDEPLRELALFAGAGGGILGGHLLGWRTSCAVEINNYAACVLAQRQNDGILAPFPIWDDIRTFDGRPWRGLIDVISGGFPCQDISVAGKGAGLAGERSGLWSEMARIISEVRPCYVFIENSPMLIIRGLDRVLADLAEMGFYVEWGCISAADCGAHHQRERIWIVGNAHNHGQPATEKQNGAKQGGNAGTTGAQQTSQSTGPSEQYAQLADANGDHVQGLVKEPQPGRYRRQIRLHNRARSLPSWGAWPPESGLGRVADGVAARVDRIKAIGNGQVPRVAATAFTILRN